MTHSGATLLIVAMMDTMSDLFSKGGSEERPIEETCESILESSFETQRVSWKYRPLYIYDGMPCWSLNHSLGNRSGGNLVFNGSVAL